MMDDIGLGQVLVNLIYLALFFVAIAGVLIFLGSKKRLFAFWWVSVMGNVFTFLYFLGDSTFIGWMIRLFSMVAWPAINLFWLGWLVFAPKAKK